MSKSILVTREGVMKRLYKYDKYDISIHASVAGQYLWQRKRFFKSEIAKVEFMKLSKILDAIANREPDQNVARVLNHWHSMKF